MPLAKGPPGGPGFEEGRLPSFTLGGPDFIGTLNFHP